nr:MAG TPA: hypothetical protein [Caudoviricetes sp.]
MVCMLQPRFSPLFPFWSINIELLFLLFHLISVML